jgi:hypothetical protein
MRRWHQLLRGRVRWQDNLGNGVCGLAFDRATVPMNKLLATTLEAQWHAFDARTLHKKSGGHHLQPLVCCACYICCPATFKADWVWARSSGSWVDLLSHVLNCCMAHTAHRACRGTQHRSTVIMHRPPVSCGLGSSLRNMVMWSCGRRIRQGHDAAGAGHHGMGVHAAAAEPGPDDGVRRRRQAGTVQVRVRPPSSCDAVSWVLPRMSQLPQLLRANQVLLQSALAQPVRSADVLHMLTSANTPRLGARYNYPDQRWRKTFGLGGDGKEKEGVAGTTTLIADLQLAGVHLTPVFVRSNCRCRLSPANAPWTCRIEAPGAWQMCSLPVHCCAD